jgi:hypothetical protein
MDCKTSTVRAPKHHKQRPGAFHLAEVLPENRHKRSPLRRHACSRHEASDHGRGVAQREQLAGLAA